MEENIWNLLITMKKATHYWVYILLCDNGNYYTGYTNNLLRRYFQHLTGKGNCKYTRSFRPLKIAQAWIIFEDQGIALKVENFVKRRNKKIKTVLVKDPDQLKSMMLNKLGLNYQIHPFDPAIIDRLSLLWCSISVAQ